MDYAKLLKQAIDLHVHIGPEIIPRKFTLSGLLDYEKGKLQGIGVKNHFFPTVAMDNIAAESGKPFVIQSVVLNHYIGGFNPDIIRASAELSEKPIIVWFPTLHAKNFLASQEFEIPEEWVDSKFRGKLQQRQTKDIKGLSVFDAGGKIHSVVTEALKIIKECGAILATGHISWQESQELVRYAMKEVGLKKIIVTHPMYQKIDMPIEAQRDLTRLGAFMEHCFSMYSIDKIPINKIVEQIKDVGAKNCILSSDVGQTFSKSPSEALAEFAKMLGEEGVTKQEIEAMLVENPAKLVLA